MGIGAGDRLVAVSNFDVDRPGVSGLPRVGDYRNIDWERLSGLRPDVLVIQVLPEKLPPAVRERAAAMHLRLVNIRIDRLDDVFTALRTLGDALGTPDRAAATEQQIRDGLDAVRRRVAGKAPVRVYLARDANALDTVGGGNFMDDLLTLAGGQNVIQGGEHSYPTIDREKLLELNPDVVLQLLPAAAPQVKQQASQFWAALPQLAAVKNHRVYVLDDYYVLQPGPRIADTAARFAELLHPELARPGTQVSRRGDERRDAEEWRRGRRMDPQISQIYTDFQRGNLAPLKSSSAAGIVMLRYSEASVLCGRNSRDQDRCFGVPQHDKLPGHSAEQNNLCKSVKSVDDPLLGVRFTPRLGVSAFIPLPLPIEVRP